LLLIACFHLHVEALGHSCFRYIYITSRFRIKKRYSVRLYRQLFVGGRISYLRDCVCLRKVVSNAYCVVFLFCFSSSCIPYDASVCRLSIIDCPFGILLRLFTMSVYFMCRMWFTNDFFQATPYCFSLRCI
jgi:hypothetical protein